MSDPKRWLDEGGGATFEERELLDAGQRAAIPGALRQRIWLGVVTGGASIGAATNAAGALGNASATKGVLAALAGSAATKAAVAIALVGGTVLGVAAYRASPKSAPVSASARVAPSLDALPPASEPARSPDEIAASSIPVVPAPFAASFSATGVLGPARPVVASRSASSRPAATVAPNDDVGPRETSVPSRVVSRLREESAAVLAIRKTLLGGDAAMALRMLDRAGVEFPNGALSEEREALAVRALVASGQNELARKRGEAFLRTFPRSPHASEVRAVLGP